MTYDEAEQIRSDLLELIKEKKVTYTHLGDFINELEVMLESQDDSSVVDKVEGVLSVLQNYAFPVNKDDVQNLYTEYSIFAEDQTINNISLVDPVTKRTINLKDVVPAADEDDLELKRIFRNIPQSSRKFNP